jgi:serine/threonine-protein kinase
MGDREIGARSDVYALGAMTYEMLAGEPPFTGPTAQAIVAKVLTEQPTPLRAKRPTVPLAAEAAILTALQKLPADRWGTAKEFSDALGGTGPQHAPSAPTVPLKAAVAGGRKRSSSAVQWLGWVAAGFAAAVAGWALLRPYPQLPPSRLAILAPGLGGSGASSSQRHVTFLPGGDELVYSMVGPEGNLRFVRQSLDADTPSPIPGAFGMGSPAISPDGRWLVGTLGGRNQVLRILMEGAPSW